MKKSILVVDDDELILRSIGTLLDKQGYQVEAAQDGYEAIDKVSKQEFDLIICDIRMPGLNGIDTIQKIRHILKEKRRNSIPEIFFTGYAEENMEKAATNMKVKEYIYKPFDLAVFLNSVKKAIGS